MALTATPVRLFQVKVATALGSVYANATTKKIIKELEVCNTANTATEFSLAIVPTGDTYDAELHTVFKDVSLARNESKIFQLSLVIEVDDDLRMVAGNTGICVYCSGVDMEVVA